MQETVVKGRAIVQAARVRARVRSCGICGGQNSIEKKFSPTTLVSHANLYSTHFSTIIVIWGWDNWQTVAAVPNGLGARAIAQAVSRWLPTAASRVRARVCGICGE
jgi:hypothetical protein